FADEFMALQAGTSISLCLDDSGRWGSLFFQHQPVGIANVFFQLLERGALAEDTRYLWQAPDVLVAVLPIFKTESSSCDIENLVEAAGVEPASEKARHEEPTMRIRLE